MDSSLQGRCVQIAGSAAPNVPKHLLTYAHDLVGTLSLALLKAGSTLVAIAGREDRDEQDPEGPGRIFDWSMLQVVLDFADLRAQAGISVGQCVIIVSSEKAESQIPPDRQGLWEALLTRGLARIERIEPGWNAGAYKREAQAKHGDILVLLGGGEGVEHLALLYANEGKPVLPLDLPLGSRMGDGHGGAEAMARRAVTHPHDFIALPAESAAAQLMKTSTRQGKASVESVVQNIMTTLEAVATPEVFYVRLVNRSHEDFLDVEKFFRNVVDPVMKNDLRFAPVEIGTSEATNAFMNVEIFTRLHYSAAVVVDVTGLRPNCFMELGYALGRHRQVFMTARHDVNVPFDPSAIPRYVWSPSDEDAHRQQAFRKEWHRSINRGPLVQPRRLY